MHIRPYRAADTEAVIALWEACDLTRPWNDPRADIARKLADSPELLLVGEEEGRVVGTVMAGYDGHRGWINYLAVAPASRARGLGRALMDAAEERLAALGCAKINLQVREGNDAARAFYEAIGYRLEPIV
ncbi:MAG: GNAT family acetyltransferase, partial [Candidatus Limnocylindrales bacterium]